MGQCCHSIMKKNPRIYLEKKIQNNKKTQTYKMLKKSKPTLKCTLAVLAHQTGKRGSYRRDIVRDKDI